MCVLIPLIKCPSEFLLRLTMNVTPFYNDFKSNEKLFRLCNKQRDFTARKVGGLKTNTQTETLVRGREVNNFRSRNFKEERQSKEEGWKEPGTLGCTV